MSQIAEGWEIVSCRAGNARHLKFMLLQLLFMVPDTPPVYSTATWTVRQTATGMIRTVTAQSEQDAREKIALDLFDAG
jgi:hypothetical protein